MSIYSKDAANQSDHWKDPKSMSTEF